MSILERVSATAGRISGAFARERDRVLRMAQEQVEFRNQRVSTEEIGFTGLEIVAGVINEEYLDALEDLDDRISEYDRMRAVAAPLVTAITLPIRGARWYVEPAEQGKREEVEIAESIEHNLFEGMSHTWDDFVRHALMGVFYGFALFEKVWEIRDGEARWRKFAPRAPKTVYRWRVGEGGGLAGVEQRGYDYDEDGNWSYVSSRFIPVEKLLLMSWQQEYGNFEGRGLFRDAYRYFWMLDKLYTLACIRVERTACPTPVASYIDQQGPTLQEDAEEKLQTALGRIRTYESGGIVLPKNVTLDKFEIAGSEVPFLEFIEHCHQMLLRTGLAQFIGLGQGENTGAYALSRDASSLFLSSLNGTTQWICDYINRYAIPQRVAYNWGEREQYPRLVCEDIGVRDSTALAQMLKALSDASLLDRGDEIGEYVRAAFDLPEMPEEETPVEEQQGAPEPEPEEVETSHVGDDRIEPVLFAEGKASRQLQKAEDEFRAEGEAIIGDMVRQYLQRLRPVVEERRWADMAEVRVPLAGKYENWLRKYLLSVVELGRDAIAATEDKPRPIPNELRQWIRAQARSLAEYHTGIVSFVVRQGLMNDLQGGMDIEAALRNAMALTNATMSGQATEDLLAASEIATEKLQAGEA